MAATIQDGGRSAVVAGAALGALIGPSAFGVTAATVALPDAAAGLGTTPVAIAWPLTSYITLLALASAIGARLVTAHGGRAVLWAGAALTAAGTLGTLLAPTLATLTLARAVLAAGAGALAALALALAGEMPASQRPRALGALAAVMAGAIGLGPLLGGVLTAWSWQVALALPVLALAAVPVVARLAAAARPRTGATVDARGAVLLSLSAGGLIVVLQASATGTRGSLLAVLAAVAVAAAARMAARVAARPEGLLPKAVVGRREFAGWWLTALGAQSGQVAALVVVPQLLGARHGWSTSAAGLALAALSLAGVAASRAAADRAGTRRGVHLAAGNLTLLGATLVLVPLLGAPAWLLLVVAGFGFAALSSVQVVALHHVADQVPDRLVAVATGIVSLALLVGGAAGSALTSLAAGSVGFAGAAAVVAALPLLGGASALALARRPSPAPCLPATACP